MSRFRLSVILTALITLFACIYAQAQDTTSTTTTTTIIPSTSTTVTTPTTTTTSPTTTTTVTPTSSGQQVVVRKEIVTTVPSPKEIVEIPAGFTTCDTIEAGWDGDIWVPRHQVCRYSNQPGKMTWVEGFWACTTYKIDDGTCTNWEWRPGHWSDKVVSY